MLSLSFISSGCGGDAAKAAKTFEKICKDNCDCPENIEDWNDISNCKKACEGYGLYTEAMLADRTAEPCAELGEILQELEDCNIGICGYDYNPGCDYTVYYRLNECWPADSYDYNSPYGDAESSQREQVELLRKLLHPIPTAHIQGETLHQAN